jgi:hypothetical protein
MADYEVIPINSPEAMEWLWRDIRRRRREIRRIGKWSPLPTTKPHIRLKGKRRNWWD